MIEAEGEAAKYWPRWRGPTGQGVVKGSSYPDSWNGPESARWKTAIPGKGNSSPIVFRDRIFLTTAYDDGQRLSLLCYRRSDGKMLWETFVPQQEGAEKASRQERPCLRHAGDRRDACLRLLRHARPDRRRSRRQRVVAPAVRRLENYHGSAGSPILYRDSVIIYHDAGKTASFVAAYDARTGQGAVADAAGGDGRVGHARRRSAPAIATS